MPNKVTKVLVCGGRCFGKVVPRADPAYEDRRREHEFVIGSIDRFAMAKGFYGPAGDWMLPEGMMIISGGATGVDSSAIDWAVINWSPFKEYKADWEKFGKKAGFIRNKQMLEEEHPDFVLAFPGGKGTANMVKLAREAGIEIIEFKYG